jgi:YjbE family integral membrane protein
MELGWLGHLSLDWNFFSGLFSIIVINLILSGDNAVVIALAVRSLPRSQRVKGIAFGSAAAVLLRVVLTFFAAQMLQISFLKIIGGVLIAWIAVKLFLEEEGSQKHKESVAGFMQAIRIILVADLIMSLDNVLAVAAASKGNLFLLIFGLALSIPIVVGTSTLLSRLMDRYPFIIFLGSALLGKVAGEMIITDPVLMDALNPGTYTIYGVEALFTIGVVVAGKLLARRSINKKETR